MVSELSNRPAGGRESDFNDLNDWTIKDIASTQKTAPEDRKNAEAEIARRQKTGTYDPENAPKRVRSDLLEHNYSLDNGKVLYPTPEYKAWLESDRSEPIPSGMIRESIQDRLSKERIRSLNQNAGRVALETFEDAPSREKIDHPSKSASKRDSRYREYENNKKAIDIDRKSRRQMKESNKYNNDFLAPNEISAAEAKANLPIVETIETSPEHIHALESAKEKTEKLYNSYKENFLKKAPRWISSGVSSLLERGIVNPPVESLLRKGFQTHEEEDIHNKIDPNNTFTPEASDMEANVKLKVAQDLIPEKLDDVLAQKDREGHDMVKNAKYKGALYSIYTGARIDNRSGNQGKKVVYSIPVEYGKEVHDFMEDVGVDFNDYRMENKALTASYQGFANIIEAIKDNDKETEKGFKTLDWYFDNFNYKKHLDDFLDNMDAFQENADDAWVAKFEEYMKRRPEFDAYFKQLENKPIPRLSQVTEISEDDLQALYLDTTQQYLSEAGIIPVPGRLNIFPDIESYPVYNHSGAVKPVNAPPTSLQKLKKVITEFAKTKAFDPNANVYRGVFTDNAKREKEYIIIRYGMRHSNIAIAVPIEHNSNDASFVWIGETGDNRDGWMDAFVQNSDPNTPTSKYQAHLRKDVRAHNHIAAMKTRGLNALENMWYNIYKDIYARAV